LEVTYWDEHDKEYDPRRLMNHKLMKITLTGEDDAVKLEYFQDAVKSLQRKKASAYVEVVLSKGMKYAFLVRLYDICQIEDANRYLHFKDKFLVFSP
jgi:hypothetical protein